MNITSDGKEALIKLAQGDMRKVINILQSCAMAFPEVIWVLNIFHKNLSFFL